MRYCINCAALGDTGYDRNVAANCGNHVFVDTEDERARKKHMDALRKFIAGRAQKAGLDVASGDVTITNDTDFLLSFSEQPSIRTIDALSREFVTQRINWALDGGYWDTQGFHEEGFIEILGAKIRERFPVTDSDKDAPDGVVLMLESRGGYFKRVGTMWEPVTDKEYREYIKAGPDLDVEWPS
jgi:hypothetical protein